MTDIGELVDIDISALESEESHDELELEITDIFDGEGTSIMDDATLYNPRENALVDDSPTRINYKLKNQSALVFIVIEAVSKKRVKDYYRNSSIDIYLELRDPGEFTIEWGGCGILSRHYVIEGKYKVVISAICPICGKDVEVSTTFKVKKPLAHCYGGKYTGHLSGYYGGRANSAKKRLKKLKDGSGFLAKSYTKETAANALVKMHEESAVWFWGGHGGPGIISMPTATTMTALVSEPALIPTYSGLVTAANCANVKGLPDNALEDVFLIVLCGCKTAESPGTGDSLPVALTKKGANIVIGFKLSVFTTSANKWTKNFFKFLQKGMTIKKSMDRANKCEVNLEARNRLKTCRILTSSGASSSAKLHPARYGRKSL